MEYLKYWRETSFVLVRGQTDQHEIFVGLRVGTRTRDFQHETKYSLFLVLSTTRSAAIMLSDNNIVHIRTYFSIKLVSLKSISSTVDYRLVAMEGSATAAMACYLAIVNDERPSSLLECETEGADCQIDQEKYEKYKQKEADLEEAEKNVFFSFAPVEEEMTVGNAASERTPPAKKRKKKSCKSLRPYYFDDKGNIKYLLPTETVWYYAYARPGAAPPEGKLGAKFRRRFRLPYPAYLDLLAKLQSADKFRRWQQGTSDAVGEKASPLGLLLLGALRYLGRGLTFDDLEEYTAIGEETHRQFFHVFIKYGADTLYPEYVSMPTTAEQYQSHQSEFNMGGLTGAGFSTDASNVIMWRCEHNLKQANIGFKNSHPARTYNVSVNHRQRVLHSTGGHPGRWNDKTLAIFDNFLSGIHESKILQDVEFELFAWSGAVGSDVCVKKYRGAWGLVDNGYHRWSCTQAPSKVNNLLIEQRLSDWIESFRKDSECFFGILKGRWRILKTGIRLQGSEAADRVWLTCCALHNMLLNIDGLDKEWEAGVPSDWEGELGRNDADECRQYAPFAIQRLNNPALEEFGSREHEREASSIRPAEPDSVTEEHDSITNERTADGAIYVNSLSYKDFRDRLVAHFDILHRRNQIQWPTRGKMPAPAAEILS